MKMKAIHTPQYFKTLIIAVTFLYAGQPLLTAQVNTLYHMKTVATRHEMNPSFQPLPNSYYSFLPVLSGLYLGAGNNSLNLGDILHPKRIGSEYKTVWFYNDEGSIDDFYRQLKNNMQIYSESNINLIAFGIRILDSSYISVGLNTRASAGVFIPKDLARLLIYGTPDVNGINSFNFDRLGARANVYTELALGYSQHINSKLTVGGKLKLLAGHAGMTTKIDRIRLNASKERWDFDIRGTVNMSAPGVEYELDEQQRIENINYELNSFRFGDMLGGFGAAIDLGASYKLLNDRLTVSAAMLDLGFISWKAGNAANMPVNGKFEFEGMEIRIEDGIANWEDDYFDNIQDNIDYTTTFKPYISGLAAKIILGAEYGILNNRMSFGAMSKSTLINKSLFQEITASFNYIQFDFFNASLSYSLLNGRFGTIGLGLGGRLGPINLYAAGDYMPVKYAKKYIPYKNQSLNFQMGILLNFGNRKALRPETVQPESGINDDMQGL
jgi:hypothetical protein